MKKKESLTLIGPAEPAICEKPITGEFRRIDFSYLGCHLLKKKETADGRNTESSS